MLETVLALATSAHPEPHLIEVGRVLAAGGGARLLLWSDGLLAAAIAGDRVHIRSCESIAVEGAGAIAIAAADLAWLYRACCEWSARRDEWGSVTATRSPPHPLGRTRYWYDAPGARSRPREIEVRATRETVRRCREPRVIAPDLRVTADFVCTGLSGARGVSVGAQLTGPVLKLDMRRDRALVWRRRRADGLTLHPEHEALIAALRDVAG